ncbi:UdgX family uracil-DNA binding protein [Alsobacter metallidurans]|nr:UdgX family uracil-DNA binding protein [Alsobacter metallidurans]
MPHPNPDIHRVQLAGDTDFAGFRDAARLHLRAGIPPGRVVWDTAEPGGDLFGDAPAPPLPQGEQRAPPRVSRAFLDTAQSVALHREPGRFRLIYQLLWRLCDEPRLMSVASDQDVMRFHDLAKAVRRDIHKMHAFLRFRDIYSPDGEAFVAWYEPDNHIVEAASPFFVKRFASLRWTILTPERSAHWTGDELLFGPGANRRQSPQGDPLEELWRSYYANIFNPARLNTDAMRAEMPKRFWKNLPEAALIPDLVAGAAARTAAMIEAAPTFPVHRRGAELPEPADAAAADAQGLPAIAAAAKACRACPLWEQATQTVPGEGPETARLMVVGEQPGDLEDIAGRPFVGPAGRIFDQALAQAGVGREGAYVTNAVKHFKFEPRGKRRIHKRPAAGEIHACLPWLEREVATVDPEVIVMLGASAAQAVLGRAVAVTRERGQPFRLPDGRWGVIATHPSYILRLQTEPEKDAAFAALVSDLKTAADLIGPSPGSPA